MKTPSQLGQKIRAVRKCNDAIARAFRHFAGTPERGRILQWRAFKRHFRQACKIQRRHELTILDSWLLPPDNLPHKEPSYSPFDDFQQYHESIS